jgi:curli production assembly/transport component CsgF
VRSHVLKGLFGLACAAVAFAGDAAYASQLVYKPTNPNFGGDPFNGSFLLSEAQAQNLYSTNASQAAFKPPTQLQQLEQRVQDAVLSAVAQNITSQILGPNAQPSGTYVIGSTTITFTTSGGIAHITITDPTGSTTVDVPISGFSGGSP